MEQLVWFPYTDICSSNHLETDFEYVPLLQILDAQCSSQQHAAAAHILPFSYRSSRILPASQGAAGRERYPHGIPVSGKKEYKEIELKIITQKPYQYLGQESKYREGE